MNFIILYRVFAGWMVGLLGCLGWLGWFGLARLNVLINGGNLMLQIVIRDKRS